MEENVIVSAEQLGKCKICLSELRGRNCQKCLSHKYTDNNNTLVLPYSVKSAETIRHMVARFQVRAFRGMECGRARKFRFRWFVLTESDEAIEAGLDFDKVFHGLIKMLRYWCPDFQYILVKHLQTKGNYVTRQGTEAVGLARMNYHIVSYGTDKLPLGKIKEWWEKHYYSRVTGMAEIVDIKKSIQYLCGYLGGNDKFVDTSESQGWVFPGWLGMGRKYKKKYGEYMSSDMLVKLAMIKEGDREYEIDFLREFGMKSEEVYRIKDEQLNK